MVKLIIDGLMNDEEIRWKKIKCCCSKIEGDVEHQHPIGKCTHCKCQEAENSMPRESFKMTFSSKDENDKDVVVTKTIKRIKINRGKKLNDILGWYNVVEN